MPAPSRREGQARGLKVLAPARSAREVRILLAEGAEEIYCSLAPPGRPGALAWMDRPSPAGGPVTSYDELAAMVETAHGRGAPLYLALDGVVFGAAQADCAAETAARCLALGVDALILAEVGLLHHLLKAGIEAPFHLSSLGSAFNSRAVGYYASLGARRIILPRQMTLGEVERLAMAHPTLEFETFVLNDGCLYDEGSCRTSHLQGHFCLLPWTETWERQGQPLSDEEAGRMARHRSDCQRLLWAYDNCASCLTSAGLPQGPCALCALWRLYHAGVAAARIAARDGGLRRKVAGVRLVRAVLEGIRRGERKRTSQKRALRLRGTPELCASGYLCYYRDCEGPALAARVGQAEP
jgi:hypothetical protein